ncbi:MAG TPA: GNAT family protein [Trueperaceae bacterium]|nr:GNAT family protein [Trueperaceae bacterium]
MIDAEVEVGDARHPNYPAPEHSFALKLDDDLAVRLSERHHAESIYRLVERDRSHLTRWVPWTAEATKESVRQLVAEELERFGSGDGWRGELCYEGRPIGLLWLHDWGGAGGSTEVGYLIAKDHEGKGLVTRALKGLMRHFFEDRGVGRVAIGLDARNDRSLAVVRRLGFRPEAVLRRLIIVDGEPTDLSMFGLLREEYEARHGRSEPHRRPPRFALAVDPAEDLYLAIYEPDDAPELYRLVNVNRDRLLPWMPWARDTAPEAELRFVTQRAMPGLVSGSGLEVGIWSGGRLVGSAGLHDVYARSRSAAIGYWIDENHQGRGIVTRVVRALVERCFTEPLLGGEPFERLEVTADVNNLPSRAVPERLGFQFEGVLRRNNVGGYTPDTAVYSLLRSEWEGSRRPTEDVPTAAVLVSP